MIRNNEVEASIAVLIYSNFYNFLFIAHQLLTVSLSLQVSSSYSYDFKPTHSPRYFSCPDEAIRRFLLKDLKLL